MWFIGARPPADGIRALKAVTSVLGGVQGANGTTIGDRGAAEGADGVGVLVVADDEPARRIGSKLEAADEPLAVDATGPAGVDDRLADGTNCVVSTGADVDLELLERVRAVDPTLPFVSLVDEDAGVDPADALEAGVTDVVVRPPDDRGYRLIARRVHNYAERHRCGRAERRLESIFQHSPDAILVHDEAGRILEVNDRTCEYLGYDRAELLELSVRDVEVGIDPEDLDDLWTSYEPGEPVTVEGRHRRADGSTFPVEVNLGRIRLPGGEQFLAIARDVTESRRRERELEAQNRLLEERADQIEFFDSLLRHDVLNGMTVVLGYADRLLESLPEDDDRHEYAEAVSERAGDVVGLILRVRSVLERLTEDHEPSLSPTDLAAVAEERADALADSFPEATVTVDVPPNAPVTADSFLEDVLENLLHNAVGHHDGDAPRVAVSVEAGPETTILRVADDGPSIPDDLRERVFERGETSGGGTGFGLYFVDVMVSEYGGEVRIEDNDPRGTVVVVELPTA